MTLFSVILSHLMLICLESLKFHIIKIMLVKVSQLICAYYSKVLLLSLKTLVTLLQYICELVAHLK